MSVLASLIKIAVFRLERLESERASVHVRISRLCASRQVVEDHLHELQCHYESAVAGDTVLSPALLVGLRQLWIEAQDRRTLLSSLNEQIDGLIRLKVDLDSKVKSAWARKVALERAYESLRAARITEDARRDQSDADEWSMRHLFTGRI